MKITQFNSSVARQVALEAEAALQAVAAKYGIAVKYTGGKYTVTGFSPKLEFSVVSTNGEVLTREVEDFKKYAFMHGLSPDDLGKEFRSNGDVYAVSGLKPNSHKFPILATNKSNGKTYKFRSSAIRLKFGKDA